MLEFGESYYIKANAPEDVCGLFNKTAANKKGLIICRCNPQKVCKMVDTKRISHFWLTDSGTTLPHKRPQYIEQLCYDIERYMQENRNSVVFISGIEYLISYTSFNEILHLVQKIKDLASIYKVILIVYLGINTLEEKQENMIKQELIEISDKNG